MLGLMVARRRFSSFGKLAGANVMLSSTHPFRLKVPVRSDHVIEVTIDNMESVAHFEEKVLKCATDSEDHSDLLVFNLKPESERLDKQRTQMRDFITSRFKMKVNDQLFTVYPNFEAMIEKTQNRHEDYFKEAIQNRNIPIARRVLLKHFIDTVFSQMDFLHQKQRQATPEQVREAFDKSLDQISIVYKEKLFENALKELEEARAELAEVLIKQEELKQKATRYANSMIYMAAGVALAQFVAMGDLIFLTYSWDVMEPLTYLVSKKHC